MKTHTLTIKKDYDDYDTLFGLRKTELFEKDGSTASIKERYEIISSGGGKLGDFVIYQDGYSCMFIGASKQIFSPKLYELTEKVLQPTTF